MFGPEVGARFAAEGGILVLAFMVPLVATVVIEVVFSGGACSGSWFSRLQRLMLIWFCVVHSSDP